MRTAVQAAAKARFVIPHSMATRRLDIALPLCLPHLSRRQWRRALDEGLIRRNNEVTRVCSKPVARNDVLEVHTGKLAAMMQREVTDAVTAAALRPRFTPGGSGPVAPVVLDSADDAFVAAASALPSRIARSAAGVAATAAAGAVVANSSGAHLHWIPHVALFPPDLHVLHCDSRILIVNKPAGVLCQPVSDLPRRSGSNTLNSANSTIRGDTEHPVADRYLANIPTPSALIVGVVRNSENSRGAATTLNATSVKSTTGSDGTDGATLSNGYTVNCASDIANASSEVTLKFSAGTSVVDCVDAAAATAGTPTPADVAAEHHRLQVGNAPATAAAAAPTAVAGANTASDVHNAASFNLHHHPLSELSYATLALDELVAWWLAHKEGSINFLHMYHRIDRCASGAVVFVRNRLAVVQGVPEWRTRVCREPIGRTSTGWKFGVSSYSRGSKPARTSFVVIATGPDFAVIECSPSTGRTHQIRVHLSHLGHTIIGDVLYGANIDQWPVQYSRSPEGLTAGVVMVQVSHANEASLIYSPVSNGPSATADAAADDAVLPSQTTLSHRTGATSTSDQPFHRDATRAKSARALLHSHRIVFSQPVRHVQIAVEAPLPPDMQSWIDAAVDAS